MQVVDRYGDLADRLHGVRMELRTVRVGDRGEFSDRLHCADLVVRMHDRHEDGLVRDRRLEVGRVDDTATVDWQQSGRPPTLGEGLEGRQYRLVFYRAGNQMATLGWCQGLGHATNGKVVRFGPTAGEDDFLGTCPDQRGDRGAGVIDVRFGRLPKSMDARGVAEVVAKDPADRLDDLGMHRGRGVMIDVDAHRFPILPLPLTISNERTRQD